MLIRVVHGEIAFGLVRPDVLLLRAVVVILLISGAVVRRLVVFGRMMFLFSLIVLMKER